jgi:hypothetical protein
MRILFMNEYVLCWRVAGDSASYLLMYASDLGNNASNYLKATKECRGGRRLNHSTRNAIQLPIYFITAMVDNQAQRSSLHLPDGLAQRVVTHLGYHRCQRLPFISKSRPERWTGKLTCDKQLAISPTLAPGFKFPFHERLGIPVDIVYWLLLDMLSCSFCLKDFS